MWNILLNDDEAMITESVRAFLSAEMPLERLRPKAVQADWQAIRRNMAELGWFAVGLSEECGGAGLGLVEEMLIQREFGRYVVSPSTLAIVLAGHICSAAGDPARAVEATSGEAAVGLALLHPDARGMAPAYLFDWQEGGRIVAWTDAGIGLFPAAALSGWRPEEAMDDSLTLHSGTLALDKAIHWIPARQSPLLARARVLIAAALVGLADHACDLTVAYAKIREQFGSPIGAFQAVKHRCADMGVRTRLAWYQTNVACLKTIAEAPDAALQTDSALLLAAEAAHENGRAGIQMHGGIGFQAECDIHWFMKRAHVYDQLAGGRLALARSVLSYPPAA
ncbi:MAG: acyl-CoA/acyl-ACP dehydrogenase [Novosphingobium sp.]|jgi:alkylation response protein AidB-like acyl-CoA dehydrogenase|nr:acyl-CoA/acyl-ACP dehydrogenase [Novosphingobium sp.]